MPTSWRDIAERYDEMHEASPDEPIGDAFNGMAFLVRSIETGDHLSLLAGQTSMHTLWIRPVKTEDYMASRLEITPQHDGTIDFRYIDTEIKQRQWHRVEPADRALVRLRLFVKQLGWISRIGELPLDE